MSSIWYRYALANVIVLFCFVFLAESALSDVLGLPEFKSNEERSELTHQALAGSPEAADKMAGHFMLLAGDAKLYWSIIAAENGSKIGVYNVANILAEMSDEVPYGQFRRDREFFWLQKALANGNRDAIAILKDQYPHPNEFKAVSEEQVKQWVLSKKTLVKFKRSAMRGSKVAAYEVFKFYSAGAVGTEEAMFWAQIAAQNGHPKAPYAIGKLMLKTGKANDIERAQFWLRKAAAGGDKSATKLLETLSQEGRSKPMQR